VCCVNTETVCDYLMLCDVCGLKRLRKACEDFLKSMPKEVLVNAVLDTFLAKENKPQGET